MSLFGVLGVHSAVRKGSRSTVLGLNFGIDFFHPAVKLPFVGRLGVTDRVRAGNLPAQVNSQRLTPESAEETTAGLR